MTCRRDGNKIEVSCAECGRKWTARVDDFQYVPDDFGFRELLGQDPSILAECVNMDMEYPEMIKSAVIVRLMAA